MKKIKIGDLEKIREKIQRTTNLRESKARAKVTIHMGTCGIAAGARKILTSLLEEIEKENLKDILVTTSGCAGLCSHEPMATVEIIDKPPVKYADLTNEKIKEILMEQVFHGVTDNLLQITVG